jgi:hypothetical protein
MLLCRWLLLLVLARVVDRALAVCERRLDGACVCCLVEGEGSKSCVCGFKEEPLRCCRRVLAVLFEKVNVSVIERLLRYLNLYW